jgi:hypothetical protein
MDIVAIQLKGDIMEMEAHLVWGTFNSIKKSIYKIIEVENNAYGSIPKANEQLASEEVGGFEVFGYLPELDRLANGNILKYEEIKNQSWGTCFNKLAYDSRYNKYVNKIMELNRNTTND